MSAVIDTRVQLTLQAIDRYIQDELLPFEKQHNISWEGQPSKTLLQQVWKRSAELGFYGLMLPVEQGGAGFSAEQMCQVKAHVAASGAVLAQAKVQFFPSLTGRTGPVAPNAAPFASSASRVRCWSSAILLVTPCSIQAGT